MAWNRADQLEKGDLYPKDEIESNNLELAFKLTPKLMEYLKSIIDNS